MQLYLLIDVRNINSPPNHLLSLRHTCPTIHSPLPLVKVVLFLHIILIISVFSHLSRSAYVYSSNSTHITKEPRNSFLRRGKQQKHKPKFDSASIHTLLPPPLEIPKLLAKKPAADPWAASDGGTNSSAIGFSFDKSSSKSLMSRRNPSSPLLGKSAPPRWSMPWPPPARAWWPVTWAGGAGSCICCWTFIWK